MREIQAIARFVGFLLFLFVVVPVAIIVSLASHLVDDGAPLYYPPPVKGERIEPKSPAEKIIKNVGRFLGL